MAGCRLARVFECAPILPQAVGCLDYARVSCLHPALVALIPHRAGTEAFPAGVPQHQLQPVRIAAVHPVWRHPVRPAGLETHRSRLVEHCGGVAQVHSVGAPFEDSAAVEVVEAPPAALNIERVVRAPRGRSQPTVPVHDTLGRFRLSRQPVVRSKRRVPIAGSGVGVQCPQGAELSASRKVDTVLEVSAVPALGPGLVHPAQPLVGVRQGTALGDRHRAGLFAVDVLARLRGQDRQEGVPAVARGDQDGVNVLAFPEIIHVRVHLAVVGPVVLVDLRLDGFAPLVAGIADRTELHVVLSQEGLEIALSAPADPETGDVYPVARRNGTSQTKNASRDEQRRRSRGPQNATARHRARTFALWLSSLHPTSLLLRQQLGCLQASIAEPATSRHRHRNDAPTSTPKGALSAHSRR